MSDSLTITADVVDGQPITGSSGDSVVINSSVIESTAVNGEVATGAKGDKGDTGDTGPAGADAPSDHTLLTSIGTNTHAQIDTAISNSVSHIANTSNPHIVTKAQVGLSNVPNTDFTADVAANTAKISFDAVSSARLANTSGTNTGDQDLSGYSLTSHNHTGVYAPVLGADDNYVTDAEKVVIGNTSGTNTGDNATNTQYSGLAASKQDADATLTSLAAYNTNGLLTQTAADTFAGRTITGTTNQVNVSNGNGVSGNPTLALPQDIHTGASPTFNSLVLSTYGGIYNGAQKVFEIGSWGTPTNGLGMEAAPTGNGATLYTTGDDTNIDLNLTTKGSGAISANANTHPGVDSTYTLGTSSAYWSNTYTDRLYLNSTAYLDGSTAGVVAITGNISATNLSGTNTGDNLIIGTTTPAPSIGAQVLWLDTTGGNITLNLVTGE